MKKIILILFILCLNSVFAQFTRIQDLPEASKIRNTDLFLLTQDTTFLGGLNYKSRQLSFDDFLNGMGHKSSRLYGGNGNMIIGASSRIDSIVSQTSTSVILDSGGNPLIASGLDTLKSSRFRAFVRFETIAGLDVSRFLVGDLLEAIVVREPVPPFVSYTTKKIQATVSYTDGNIAALNYESDYEDTLKIGDIFTKVGNNRGNGSKTILLSSEGSNAPYIAGWDDITTFANWNDPAFPKFAIGNLNRFTHPIFGSNLGYGVVTDNFYGNGALVLSGKTSSEILAGITDTVFIASADKIGLYDGTDFISYLDANGSFYTGIDGTSFIYFNAPANTVQIKGDVNITSGVTYNQISTNVSNISTNAGGISLNSTAINVLEDTTAVLRSELNVTAGGVFINSTAITTLGDTTTVLRSDLNVIPGEIALKVSDNAATKASVVVSAINGGSVVISGKNIQLNGNTTVDGTFTVSGDILSGGKYTTTSGSAFGDSVSGALGGLYINTDNYILDNNSFRIGGVNGISFSGTGSIGIGSDVVVDGAVFGSNTLNGTTTIGTTGKVVSASGSDRIEITGASFDMYFSAGLIGRITVGGVKLGSNTVAHTGISEFASNVIFGADVYFDGAYSIKDVTSSNTYATFGGTAWSLYDIGSLNIITGGGITYAGSSAALITGYGTRTASGFYMAASSGGSPTEPIYKRTLSFSDGTTIEVFVP